MNRTFLKISLGALAVVGLAGAASAVMPGSLKQLHGHVPNVVSQLTPIGRVEATNRLQLAIGLPLRNQDALESLQQQIYDPASPNYRHFLTSEEFTAHFGPTAQDYQAVLDFAQASGLQVTHTHGNRMLVEVNGQASDIERAFSVTLKKYRDPKDNRDFFAPDAEPSVPVALPVLDVSGLNNYSRPHSKLRLNPNRNPSPNAGSGPTGSYMGYDFRTAYVPGTTLTGAGQKVALVQFDGYLASDIALYAQRAGLPSVSLTNILLNGFSGFPTGFGGEVEVSLDIEMVMSMAPGLSQILVYEGDPFNFFPNVVLNQIAVDNAARQVSCSWGWIGGPNATSDQIFLQMALQGQTFFNAAGDSDAFLPGQVDDPNDFGYPSCTPYITQVGGTTLTTVGRGGPRISERVWNWGVDYPGQGFDGVGSSGGISDHYPTPTWQQGFGTSTNHGSATGRNIPDVALTGDNVYVIADNGVDYPGTGGTSCAAPLWAGFTALVNQQVALNGGSSIGFLNPVIYYLARTADYTNVFHDITNGNNTWSSSPTNFFAVPGYDLCAGLGTPNGTNLIYALAALASSAPPIISAPPPPWGTNLAVMNGSNPNGAWFLFVQDDKPLDVGLINTGWFITLTTANPVGYAADSQLYVTATNLSFASGTNFSLTLAVTNYGPSSATNVFVADTLPALLGISLVSSNATLGSVKIINDTLTWSLGNLSINTGATLTLNFLTASFGTYTNAAQVYATTADPNPDDDAVSTLITVAPSQPPQLTPAFLAGAGGGIVLAVTADPNGATVIQACTNLVNPVWIPIYTNVGTFTYTNPVSTNYSMQFYRAVTGP